MGKCSTPMPYFLDFEHAKVVLRRNSASWVAVFQCDLSPRWSSIVGLATRMLPLMDKHLPPKHSLPSGNQTWLAGKSPKKGGF